MNEQEQFWLGMYVGVALIVFVGSALVLDDRTSVVLSRKERVWIGRAGLAAPLWPITAVVLLYLMVRWPFRRLIKAARWGR